MKKFTNTDRIKSAVTIFLPPMFFLLLWEGIVWQFKIVPWILPPPSQIVKSLIDQRFLLWTHTKVTLYESVIGFAIAVLLSFLIAFIMDLTPMIKKAVYPFLIISQTIPIITIAPLLVIWFGYDLAPKIFVVLLVCFFPVTINLLHGLESVDPEVISLLKIMGANKWQIFRFVKLPNSMNGIFSGLKISATYSIMGAVIGEWLGAKAGLGEYMRRSMRSFSVAKTFAAIVIITVLSFAMLQCIRLFEFWSMPWTRKKPSWMD